MISKTFTIIAIFSLGFILSSCSNSNNDSNKWTPQQISAFRAHKPTPAELQAAMPKGVMAPPTQGKP